MIYITNITIINAFCPATDFFYPCVCSSQPAKRYDLTISCNGQHINDMDVMRAFTRLNTYLNGSMVSKTFCKLNISQTSVKNLYFYEIKLFKGLKFRSISIVDNPIENFDPYIFWSSYRMNRHFILKGHKSLVNYNRRDPLPILNRFIRLEVLSITDTNYDRIPKNAFSRTEQPFLKQIILNNNEITHIDSCSFFTLHSLCFLDFSRNRIRKISDLAFAIKQPSSQRIVINLHSNNLSDTSLAIRSLHYINRPLFLILSDNLFTYLDDSIFAPLLLNSEYANTIVVSYNPLICNCRFQWIVQNKHLLRDKILGQPLCQDGRTIWSYTLDELLPC
ncbi:uncharacterized protein LOC128961659 [Oppia nitens]|uniref:uncharacterized protein LOC128961659 n=1 Tax=Oppia nitens TaxID=1686743 RepID=UPI0023DC72AD|nr:uncharacterized protein LOC128961659 [Oppia nitens]